MCIGMLIQQPKPVFVSNTILARKGIDGIVQERRAAGGVKKVDEVR